jgi:hypothetical protein
MEMKNQPCPEEWMLVESETYTFCEVLREIYKMTDDEEIRIKLRIAVSMVKELAYRLRRHEPKYLETLYDKKGDK